MELDIRYATGSPLLRYIVPFTYSQHDKTYEEAVENLKSSGWEMCSKSDIVPSNDENLNNHIYTSIIHKDDGLLGKSRNGKVINSIGCVFGLAKDTRRNMWYFYHDNEGDKSIQFSVGREKIYLFKTGVGLYCYEIGFSKKNYPTTDELITFQSRFAMLNDVRHTRDINEKYWFANTPALKSGQFTMGNDIAKKLEAIFGDVFYYPPRVNDLIIDKMKNSPDNKKFWEDITVDDARDYEKKAGKDSDNPIIVPERALLYSYVVFRPDHDIEIDSEKMDVISNLGENAYYLSTGTRNSYKAAYNEDIEKQKMLMRRENEIWKCSLEGLGCFAVVLNNIFNSDGTIKYKEVYDHIKLMEMQGDNFLLYILSLYQHYSLIYYFQALTRKIDLDSEVYKAYGESSKQLYQAIHDFKIEVDVFFANSILEGVSHSTEVCSLYEYIEDSLMIENDIDKLNKSINRLDGLQSAMLESAKKSEEEIKKDEDEKRSKLKEKFEVTMTSIAGIFGLLTVFSVFGDMLGMLDRMKMFFAWSEFEYGIAFTAAILIILIPVIICIKLFIDYKSYKKNKK